MRVTASANNNASHIPITRTTELRERAMTAGSLTNIPAILFLKICNTAKTVNPIRILEINAAFLNFTTLSELPVPLLTLTPG